jgi:hypothetical protein
MGLGNKLEPIHDDDSCPLCGAEPGMPHDELCPLAVEEEYIDPDIEYDSRVDKEPRRFEESINFDKFMDRIIFEETKRGMPVLNDSPQRKRAINCQEHPMGRMRMRGC